MSGKNCGAIINLEADMSGRTALYNRSDAPGVRGYLNELAQIAKFLISVRGAAEKILFITKTYEHHMRRSGYVQISGPLGQSLPTGLRVLPGKFAKWCSRWTGHDALNDRLLLRLALLVGQFEVVYVAEADYLQWPFNPRPTWLKAKVVCTFHQPPDTLQDIVDQIPRGSIDEATTVSRCQLPIVEPLVGKGRAWYSPHGVDCDYFRPGTRPSSGQLVICVGHHRRDFVTLMAAAEIIRRRMPGTAVRLYGPRRHLPAFVFGSFVEVNCDVGDYDLLHAYQSASVLLLPLDACTANNAVLEALACAVPLVATAVGGVEDYVNDECYIGCPKGDAEAHANAVVELMSDIDRLTEMKNAARLQAIKFDWRVVRRQLSERLCVNG